MRVLCREGSLPVLLLERLGGEFVVTVTCELGAALILTLPMESTTSPVFTSTDCVDSADCLPIFFNDVRYSER